MHLASKKRVPIVRAAASIIRRTRPLRPRLSARELLVEPVEEKTIAKRVLDLDSADFATRERASKALARLDRLAEPTLRKALTGQPSLEMRRRIQQLLEQLASPPSSTQLRPLRSRYWSISMLPRRGVCWRPSPVVLPRLA